MRIELNSLCGGKKMLLTASQENSEYIKLRIMEVDVEHDAITRSNVIEISKRELLLAIKLFN